MSRNKYEEYSYIDYDNIYTYPDTNILINKFNLNSLEELKNKEYSLVASKILELYLQPILVNSIDDIYKIHSFLFQIYIGGLVNVERLTFPKTINHSSLSNHFLQLRTILIT